MSSWARISGALALRGLRAFPGDLPVLSASSRAAAAEARFMRDVKAMGVCTMDASK